MATQEHDCHVPRQLSFWGDSKQSWDASPPVQAIEEVKEEMRVLSEGGKGSLTDEQYEQKQQLLLMKWFRVTGPAKVEAGVKHVEGLLEQGEPLGQHAEVITYNLHIFLLDEEAQGPGVMHYSQSLQQALF